MNLCCGNYSRAETIQGKKLFNMGKYGVFEIKDKIINLPDEIMKRLVGSAKYLAKIWPYFASLSAEIEPTRIGTTVNSFFCSKH